MFSIIKNKLNNSFPRKVFVLFTFLIILFSFAFTVFLTYSQYTLYHDNLLNNGKLLSSILVNNIKFGLYTRSDQRLLKALNSIINSSYIINIYIYDSDKNLIKIAQPILNQKKSFQDSFYSNNAVYNNNGHNISSDIFNREMVRIISFNSDSKNNLSNSNFNLKYNHEDNVPILVDESFESIKFTQPVLMQMETSFDNLIDSGLNYKNINESIIGYTSLEINKKEFNKYIILLFAKSILIAFSFLLIGSFLIYFLTKKLTGPLNRLKNQIDDLIINDNKNNVEIETSDEIGELAISFNEVMSTLFNRERELKKSELKYRTIFENSGDGIALFSISDDSKNPILIECNSCFAKMSGRSKEELLTIGDLSNIQSIDTNNDNGDTINCFNNSISADGTYSWLRPDDSFNLNEYNRVLVRHEGQYILYSVDRDITDKKIAEYDYNTQQEQLFQAAKLASLGALVTSIAHEINNPINFSKLNIKLLNNYFTEIKPIIDDHYQKNHNSTLLNLSYNDLSIKIPKLFKDIISAHTRIENRISDLKAFSRKKSPILNDNVNINDAIQSSIKIIDNLIKQSTNNLIIKCNHNIPFIKGNYENIEQVIMNLVLNSCQSLTDKDSSITIETLYDNQDNKILLIIDDEGSGIPEGDIQNIFTPFYTTNNNGDGLGLGLLIVDSIVRNHKADMSIKSIVDKGTTVTIKFPITKTRNVF